MEKRTLAVISSQAFSLWNFRGPLIRAWVAQGWRVVALAPDYDDASRAQIASLGAEPCGYSLGRAGIHPLRDLLDLVRLTILLVRLRPACSFAYFIKPVIYGGMAARMAGIPRRYAMVEGAGYIFSDAPEGSPLHRRLLLAVVVRLYRAGLAGARKVLFLNRDDEKLFLELRMVSPVQAVCIGAIGVDLAHYRAQPRSDAPFTFILAARLLAEKGVHEYVEAARRVRAICPGVHFILLGSPDQNPGSVTEAELQGWAAEGVVEWQPHVSDVRPWFARANVYVLPSWYREGVPRGIQEAMSMGRPVITTDMPGCRDTVIDGENGYILPPRNPQALADCMLRMFDAPEMTARMGEAARRYAEQHFDVHAANERILRAME